MLICIIDDEARVVAALQELLTHDGHRVCHAYNQTAAIEVMVSERPDLVLLDVNLPRGPGLHPERRGGLNVLLEKMMDERIAGIPVALVTGMLPAEVRQLAAGPQQNPLNETVLMHLGKPVDFAKLQQVIARVSNHHALTQQTVDFPEKDPDTTP